MDSGHRTLMAMERSCTPCIGADMHFMIRRNNAHLRHTLRTAGSLEQKKEDIFMKKKLLAFVS